MAARTEAKSLTLRFKQAQARRAAMVAALAKIYFERSVAIEDSSAVETWLTLWAAKVLASHTTQAVEAAKFGNALRLLELGDNDLFRYEPVIDLTLEQVRASLVAVGVRPARNKFFEIRQLDDRRYDPQSKAAMIDEANRIAAERVARSISRHSQNGARRTLEEGAKSDPMTIGYVRVTDSDPCFFCAMLASRGLEGGLYTEDSFELSDPRFVGSGSAKVHDGCSCGIKPVYTRGDEILADNKRFEKAWADYANAGDADALTNFRRNWEGREAYLG